MLVGFITVLFIKEPDRTSANDAIMLETRVIAFMEGSHHWPKQLRSLIAWFLGAIVSPYSWYFI